MSRNILIIILALLSLGLNQRGNNKLTSVHRFSSAKRITIVNFPTDGGRWTDLMIAKFEQQLSATQMPFEFTTLSWTFATKIESFVNRAKAANPEFIFLPDDMMYRHLAKPLQEATGAFILFVAMYQKKDSLNEVTNQAGVFCDGPIDNLLKQARKFMPAKSVGIVGGPLAQNMSDRIVEKIEAIATTEVFLTKSWNSYRKKILEYSQKYDVIWPLAPFGVTTTNGKPVSDEQINALMNEVNKPALGYGRISLIQRTMDMNIDPLDIGRNAAHIAFKYFQGENLGVQEFTSYALRINNQHVNRLGLQVPKELHGFVSF